MSFERFRLFLSHYVLHLFATRGQLRDYYVHSCSRPSLSITILRADRSLAVPCTCLF